MKIIEIIPNLATGGGEKFVIDLSNAFVDAGHDCSIVTMYDRSDEDVLRCYIKKGVKTFSLGKKRGADFRCMFRILRHICKQKPDVVHAHLAAIMYLLPAAVLCRKVKFFATIHSEASCEAGTGLSRWIRKFLFKLKLVAPVTISEESEKSFERFYGFPTQMIPNGCSDSVPCEEVSNQFKSYHDGVDYLFIHAGRIHKVKNQLMLVEAFDKVLQQGVNARLLIAGRIEDKALFERMKPYLSDRIVYIGEQPNIRAIMSVADAFCLSSVMEGMPITIIEAFSVGCVPIVTPVGGCVNMIENGVNGFISASKDVEDYTNSLLVFATTPIEALQQISCNGIDTFKNNYSISQTGENYLMLFGSF